MAGFNAFASEWGVAIEFSSCGQRGFSICGQMSPLPMYCRDIVINSAICKEFFGDFCVYFNNLKDRRLGS